MLRWLGIVVPLVLGGALVVAGCASEEPAGRQPGQGASAVSTGTVTSGTAAEAASSRTSSPHDDNDGTGRSPEPNGATAGGPQRTAGPSARARLVDAAAAEDRRSGGSEARIE